MTVETAPTTGPEQEAPSTPEEATDAPQTGAEDTEAPEDTQAENGPESGAEEGTEDEGSTLSHEDAISALRDVRKEAASWRTRFRELEEGVKGKKTAEEVAALVAEITEKNAAEQRVLLAENVTLAAGLPLSAAKRLVGATREELEADAKELAEHFSSGATVNSSVGGGLTPGDNDDDFDPDAVYREIKRARRP